MPAKRPPRPTLGAAEIRHLFDHERTPTFGAEEEVLLLDPDTFDLAPCAAELIPRPRADGRLKLELPASQLEATTRPCRSAPELAEELMAGRRRLAETAGERARPGSAGAHPFAVEGPLNRDGHHQRTAREYGGVANRQLVCGLHVHVGLAGADRVLAVYNSLREYLPELAALAANAPLHEGRPAGMASVRPLIAGLLPRQGVPPAYATWEELAEDLAWGARAGRLEGLAGWWWELRIHAVLGTLELRVPDAQVTPADAAALATTAAALVLRQAALHDAGELPPSAPSWRIAENRWSSARHGLHGALADLHTGARCPTRQRLHDLLDSLAPFAAAIGGRGQIDHAHGLAERNGADRQLEIARKHGVRAVAEWLADEFLPDAR